MEFLTKIPKNRVADPDPKWIRIQSGQWIRIQSGQWTRIRNPDPESGSGIRIRIQEGNNDPQE
jgi:hypothetical protein